MATRQDGKSLKLLNRLKKEGLTKKEIDTRLKQSLDNRITALNDRDRTNISSKKKYGRLTAKAKSSTKRGLARERLAYLASIADPENNMSIIPDATTFPRSLQQIRTVGTWTPDLEGKGTIFFSPFLNMSLEVVGSSFLSIDGISYTDQTCGVHKYTAWTEVLASYRVVSMCVRVTYIGTALENSGEIAVACIPPYYASTLAVETFEEVAEYNYSYNGAARDGCYQIWMPASSSDYMIKQTTEIMQVDLCPLLVCSFKGLPITTPMHPAFKVEWTMNIEAFSTNQMLTATKHAGKPDAEALSTAAIALGNAIIKGHDHGPSNSSSSVFNAILGGIGDAGRFVWRNRETIGDMIGIGASFL